MESSVNESSVEEAVDELYNSTAFSAPMRLNVTYAVFEVLVAVAAVVGNALVMLVFRRERRLRRRTNYYIVSLAAADFLVGLLGIPFAILASVGLPRDLHACLFTVSLLVVLCTISIFCLVAVSVDRYWAILHPMGYSRNVRTKTAIGIIGVCWLAGSIVGFLPLFGWHEPGQGVCLFTKVMDYNYLVFLYFATIVFPAVILAGFYLHIYQVVLKQRRGRAGGSLRVPASTPGAASAASAPAGAASGAARSGRLLSQLRRILTMNPMRRSPGGCAPGGGVGGGGGGGSGGGTMLRMLGPIKKSEVKATQNLSIIVLFFILCWFPLYTINCIQAFRRDWKVNATLMEFCIVLSHLNSAGNPLLYAYHLRDFRAALKNFLWTLVGMRDDCRLDGPGAGVRSLGSLAQGYAVRGGGGIGTAIGVATGGACGGGVGGGGGAWGGSTALLRSEASLNNLLLAPPTNTPATTTAHSSMTSIASSVASVHHAAAAPALPAFVPTHYPDPHKVEGCRAKMSTVAEASYSEEEHSTPASAGPDPPFPTETTELEPAPSPPPTLWAGAHLPLPPARTPPFEAAPPPLPPRRCGSALHLDLGELSDGDDEVFLAASAPNAAAIVQWPGFHGGSGSATEARSYHFVGTQWRVSHLPRSLPVLPSRCAAASSRCSADGGDSAESTDTVDADDRTQLSPCAANHRVVANGNGSLRRGSPEAAATAPAAATATVAATTPAVANESGNGSGAGGGSRKLSPLKVVGGIFMTAMGQKDDEEGSKMRTKEFTRPARASVVKHHNGSVIQRGSAGATS